MNKNTWNLVDFVVPVNHKMKIKESEKMKKYLDFGREDSPPRPPKNGIILHVHQFKFTGRKFFLEIFFLWSELIRPSNAPIFFFWKKNYFMFYKQSLLLHSNSL